MAKSKAQILTLFLVSSLVFTGVQSDEDIHNILPTYGLPPGIFPNVSTNAIIVSNCYVDTFGEMTVYLSSKCYVPFPFSGLRYDKVVEGKISAGKIEYVRGIEVRRGAVWDSVMSIEVQMIHWPSPSILFNTGKVKSSLLIDSGPFNQITQCYDGAVAAEVRESRNALE